MNDSLPVPIVVGCPRSGTTLLGLILNAHPDLCMVHEAGFITKLGTLKSWVPHSVILEKLISYIVITRNPWSNPKWPQFDLSAAELRKNLWSLKPFDRSEALRLFYRMMAHQQDKKRYGEKYPLYIQNLPLIRKVLPEVKIINLIRDGRDVMSSLISKAFRPSDKIEDLAAYWKNNVELGLNDPQVLNVFYEQLIENPETTLKRICSFIDLNFLAEMLHHEQNSKIPPVFKSRRHANQNIKTPLIMPSNASGKIQTNKIGVYKTVFNFEQIRTFEEVAGDTLLRCGYSLDN